MNNRNELHMAEGGLLSFDPVVLLQDVMKRWLAILAIALAVGVGAFILTDASYTPEYRTTTTFVVTSRVNGAVTEVSAL